MPTKYLQETEMNVLIEAIDKGLVKVFPPTEIKLVGHHTYTVYRIMFEDVELSFYECVYPYETTFSNYEGHFDEEHATKIGFEIKGYLASQKENPISKAISTLQEKINEANVS